jgi:hypothetical protein
MAKFVYAYVGGRPAATAQEQEAQTQKWTAWMGELGSIFTDVGNPFAASATVSRGGSTDGGTSGLRGYSIVAADSLAEASAKAGGCPVLDTGGSVEVYEAIEM